jgi:hypothetical protein
MIKTANIILFLLICTLSFSQSKSTFSLGSGYENAHNGFISPYNYTGSGVINFNYENEKLKSKSYKTINNINFKGASLRLDHDFMNNLDKGPYNFNLRLSIDKNYLFELYGGNQFSFWSGFVSSFQSNLQVVIHDAATINYRTDYYFFLNFGLSGGLATSAQLKFKKFNIQNTCSFFLINAMLYPNYAYDLPLPGTYVPNYFTFSSVKRRQYLTNKLKVEFPLYIADELVNSFSVSYLFNYENSSINDIAIRKYEHILSLGVIFKIGKIDVTDI